MNNNETMIFNEYFMSRNIQLKEQMPGWILTEPCLTDLTQYCYN